MRKYARKRVPDELVRRCIDAARMSPVSMNHQSLRYVVVNDEVLVREIFGFTTWCAWLPDYNPTEQEMPAVFIVMLSDQTVPSPGPKWIPYDVGIAAMSISMVAFDEGLGSCILASPCDEKRSVSLEKS